MKNIIITSVAAVAVLAFAGCAPKKSCQKACPTPVAVKPAPKPVPVAVKPAPKPAPVVVTPAPVIQEVEPVEVPAIDAKEAAVQ